MTTSLITGRKSWEGERDDEGHRTFFVEHRVQASSVDDGPYTAMQTSGLPQTGDAWNFGNDNDAWAFCYPFMKVTPNPIIRDGEWVKQWVIQQKFSTKPLNRCNTASIENPLNEPQKISGGFLRSTREGILDRYGNPIRSSSHEPFHGQQVEFDYNRPNVKVEQNVISLELSLVCAMIDHLNDATLWGLAARCIKLSAFSWERKLYGVCNYYFTRSFEFEIDYNTWDRRIIDEGNKALNGAWDPVTKEWTLKQINGADPDPANPSHFCKLLDFNGNPMRAPLNGSGVPISGSYTGTGTGHELTTIPVEYYGEANLLLLSIPSTLE